MDTDEAMTTYASNEPMDGDEWQITGGIGHVNEQLQELAQQVFVASTEIGAVSNLLHERGLISKEDLKAQRAIVARRLEAVFQDKQIGVKLDTRFPDKYAIPADELPRIDCETRIPLCRAACCAMRFALSAQDLDERVMRWDLSQPYRNRVGPDKRCVHQDRASFGCTIYQHRPGVCRMYDCRKDARIWLDFENRVINPHLFVTESDGTLIPEFEESQQAPGNEADPGKQPG
ncbi:MAG TPA: YkgJ family cysteine cluster protein [Chloroflexota bacterium]|jgi:Fe-S-cluster containining protein|nr:YkgJ family cysteine cluster protein [Chloroflexota bacterium]